MVRIRPEPLKKALKHQRFRAFPFSSGRKIRAKKSEKRKIMVVKMEVKKNTNIPGMIDTQSFGFYTPARFIPGVSLVRIQFEPQRKTPQLQGLRGLFMFPGLVKKFRF